MAAPFNDRRSQLLTSPDILEPTSRLSGPIPKPQEYPWERTDGGSLARRLEYGQNVVLGRKGKEHYLRRKAAAALAAME